MPEPISIPRRFNGPLDSGNGGYCSGVVAGLLEGPAEVTLRRPVPLDTPLELVRDASTVQLLEDGALVAEGRSVPDFGIEPPAPVSPDEARLAAARYRGRSDGVFSRCFVCGRARDDAFGLFAGAVDGREVVASPWTPPAWAADRSGRVMPEFVWAVLDCPTYFATYIGQELALSVLGRLTARVEARPSAGEELVVIAWPIGVEGRKRHAGAAVLSAEGRPLALGRALLIEARDG